MAMYHLHVAFFCIFGLLRYFRYGSISKEKTCVIEIKLATLAVIVTRASANTPLHFQEAILRLSFGVRAT